MQTGLVPARAGHYRCGTVGECNPISNTTRLKCASILGSISILSIKCLSGLMSNDLDKEAENIAKNLYNLMSGTLAQRRNSIDTFLDALQNQYQLERPGKKLPEDLIKAIRRELSALFDKEPQNN